MDAFAVEFLERYARHWKPKTLEPNRYFMKVFELGYPFLWKGRKSLACRRQAKRLSYRVQTTETHIDSGGMRWDSDGPVTQSMIASII